MKKNIIRKIHHLLKLSRDQSATIYEAEVALQKAKYLLERYELQMEDVENYYETHMCEDVLFVKERLSVWDKYILNILQQFFHVEILVSHGGHYIIIGSRDHIDIAKMIYDYLKDIFVTSYRSYRKVHKRAQAQAYYMGLYSGLFQTLQEPLTHEQQQQYDNVSQTMERESSENIDNTYKYGLVKYDRALEDYLEHKYGELPKTRKKNIAIYDRQAFFQGEEVGQNIQIKRSLPQTV